MDAEITARSGRGDLREAGYELVCRLGAGGMGEIWAAARIGVEGAIKPCAIKVIRPAFAGDAQYRRMFVEEGRVAMMLGHANIVSVFDVGVVDGLLFMAMDWVDGVDLGEFRQQVQLAAGGRPLGVEEAVHIVGALLDALGYAHDFRIAGREHGIVHRDVSPRNAMVTSRGEVKLMDFGLAGLDAEIGEGTGPRFRGTLRYLSREQARGRPEPASDLFAVGAILHELLDGRRFRHACTDDDALIGEIFEGGIPVLERRIPAPVEALRRGLLEPRVELRTRSARRALTRLAAWPGYRNRRLHLEGLYRQVIGEPRSGLTQLLSLGVHSEVLDGLERRVHGPRSIRTTERSRSRGRSTRSTPKEEISAVLRTRSVEHAAIHRVASFRPESQDGDQEITEPWARTDAQPGTSEPLDESATAWMVPSSPGESSRSGGDSGDGRGGAVIGRSSWSSLVEPSNPPWPVVPSSMGLLTARARGSAVGPGHVTLLVLAALIGGLLALAVVGALRHSELAPFEGRVGR